ncbi:hypothetical protein D915_008221 [Fasciola hepatica]|uniref:Apple domain-containing protein n=1 Tax=Fasciola hepatica TaxID=6192 RepID=A0A4E0R3I7_FASHE|nr:hypothetical protein D915_008221 [Fasciola hepatica]
MILFDSKGTFCDSHALCESQGLSRGLRLFVPGKQVALMQKIAPSSANVFTGLSKFLNLSADFKAGWRYSDPGAARAVTDALDASIPWSSGEPNNINGAVGTSILNMLMDSWQFSMTSTHAVCQLSNLAWDTSADPFVMDWPYVMPYMFMQDRTNVGCFESYTVNMIIDCCAICKKRNTCRTFYFHKQTGQCWISLYVDSLLPFNMSSLGGTWFRLSRPNW